MKRVFRIILAMLICSMVWGRSSNNDLDDIDDWIDNNNQNNNSNNQNSDSSSGDDLESFDVEFDYIAHDESETFPTDESDESYEDYVENSDFTSTITYSNGAASIDGSVDGVTVTADGGDVTVNSESKKVGLSDVEAPPSL